jgi:ribosomal protein S12 methylthiotransferase accessory factor
MTVESIEAPASPAVSLSRLERAVSPLTGIANGVVRGTHAADESRLFTVSTRVASSERTLGTRTVDHAASSGPDPEAARAATIGEALERYAAAYVPHERLLLASARELGGEAVSPASFALFHERQYSYPGFPFVPFTDSVVLRWTAGFSLLDSTRAFLPAQLVYLVPPDFGDVALGSSTSNGLACGSSFEEAALAALLELVERDAVMIAWKNRLSLPLLDWSDDAEMRALDERYFAPSGLQYSVLDGSVFLGLPVAIAVLHGEPGQQAALAVGGGCAPTVAEAWLKALSEAFGVRRWLRTMSVHDPDRHVDGPAHVCTFDDHMLFYATHDRARLAAFFDAAAERTPTAEVRPLTGSTPAAQLAAAVARLASRSVASLAADVTSPDVASLGLRVVRVVAPELCALDVVHAAQYLGGKRLVTAPVEARLLAEPRSFEDFNRLPHPFP